MNAVEIAEAISELARVPFEAEEFAQAADPGGNASCSPGLAPIPGLYCKAVARSAPPPVGRMTLDLSASQGKISRRARGQGGGDVMPLSIEPELSSCSVVLLGKFNPAIIHPSWLHAKGVESDISEAVTHVDVIHRDISSFRIDTRIYEVRPDRFLIATTTAPWVSVVDIAQHLFGEFLVHTPIHALGINRTVHFHVSSKDVRNKIGRLLAPIDPWGAFGAQMDTDDPALNGGLQSLTMRRKKRLDKALLDTNAQVEPSARLKGDTGIFMEINHHHHLLDYDDSKDGALPAVDLLMNQFESLTTESDDIINVIMEIS